MSTVISLLSKDNRKRLGMTAGTLGVIVALTWLFTIVGLAQTAFVGVVTVDGFVQDPVTGVVEAPYAIQGITYTQDQATGDFAGYLFSAEDDDNYYFGFAQSVFINDNTYGANAIDWEFRKKGHSLKDLLNSDHIEVRLYDDGGGLALDFFLDYATQDRKTGEVLNLGVEGGDGRMVSGDAGHVLASASSLTWNYNLASPSYPSNDSTSPERVPTNTYDAGTAADPDSPWIYEIVYEWAVSKAAFNGSELGDIQILQVHNSPLKSKDNPTPIPVLSVKKEANPPSGSEVGLNEVITYTVTATNVGLSPINAVLITDVVDENLSGIVPLDGGTFDSLSRTISWPVVATLNPGDNVSVSFQATPDPVSLPLTEPLDIFNTATITSPDLATDVSTNTTVHTVVPFPMLNIDKTVSSGTASPGDVLTYSVTVTNVGSAEAANVTVFDDPDEAYIVSVGSISDGGIYDGDLINWSLGTLGAASSVTLIYEGTLASAASGTFPQGATQVVNTAVADSDDTDPETDTETVVVDASANLTIDKVVSEATVSPGDTLTYTITVQNGGDASAHNVSLADDPDETYVSSVASITDGGTYDGDLISWSLGTLNAGDSVTVTYDATLLAASSGGFPQGINEVVNTAVTDSDQTEPISDVETVTVSTLADITIDKVVSDATTTPGTLLSYTLIVSNVGDAPANNTTVVDDPDETYVAGIGGISNAGTYDSDLISWTLGTLNPGDIIVLSYDATLKAASTGAFPQGVNAVTNTAVADSDETVPASDTETVNVPTEANLAFIKEVSSATANPGDTLAYTLTVDNVGDAPANNTTAVDDPDETFVAGLTNISAGGSYNGDKASWSLGTLNPGDSVTLTYDVTLKDASSGAFPQGVNNVLNIAVANSDETFPIIDTELVKVITAADLIISKVVNTATASPGDSLTYALTIANVGDAPANNTSVEDDPDEAYLSSVGNVSSGGGYDSDIVSWTLGTLNPGDVVVLTYDAVLKTAASGAFPQGANAVVNTAVVDSDETDPESDTETVMVTTETILTIDKVVSSNSASPGDALSYTITVANIGDAPANGTVVTDDPDEGYIASVGGISSSGSYNGDITTWSLGTLNSGDVVVLTYDVTLKVASTGAFPQGDNLVVNTAVVDSDETEPVSDGEIVTVTTTTVITMDKVVSVGAASPGDVVTYTITVASTGDARATNMSVVDDPDEVYVASISNVTGGAPYNGDVIMWTVGTMNPGDVLVLSYDATLKTSSTGAFPQGDNDVVNTATTYSNETDPISDSETVVVTTVTILTFEKAVSDSIAAPGDVVGYTLTITNAGDAPANNAVVVDDPDETYVAGVGGISSGGSYDSDLINWALGTLNPGDTVVLTYDAALKEASSGAFPQGTNNVVNTATADSDETDPLSDTETVTVTTAANVTIDKVVSTGTASPGDTVTYMITVENTGDAPANNTSVVDDPDETYVAAIANLNGGGSYDGNLINWVLSTLNPGDSVTLTYDATMGAPGTFPAGTTDVDNIAVVDSDEEDPKDDTETVTVAAEVILGLVKESTVTQITAVLENIASVSAGNSGSTASSSVTDTVVTATEIAYLLTVTNTGDADATGVVLQDVLPLGVTVISNPDGGIISGSNISWDLGTILTSGGTVQVSVTVRTQSP